MHAIKRCNSIRSRGIRPTMLPSAGVPMQEVRTSTGSAMGYWTTVGGRLSIVVRWLWRKVTCSTLPLQLPHPRRQLASSGLTTASGCAPNGSDRHPAACAQWLQCLPANGGGGRPRAHMDLLCAPNTCSPQKLSSAARCATWGWSGAL